MSAQLKPDSDIPLQVYELASNHKVGIPLKRQKRRIIQVILLFELLIGIAMLGWLGYIIYEYIAFSILSHTYPHANGIPDNQLDTYLWLQTIHDDFWLYTLQIVFPLLTLVSQFVAVSSTYQAKLYICTDGLLKIYKKKDESVRWDDVKEFFIFNGAINRLVKQDGSNFYLPYLLLSGRDKTLSTRIIDEVTHCLLPEMLASYERGETVTFNNLKLNQKGIYRSGNMVYWEQIGGIALKKQTLSVFYSETKKKKEEQVSPVFAGKWHTWRKSVLTSASWPNLPVFVTLVNTILDQRGINQMKTTLQPQQLSQQIN